MSRISKYDAVITPADEDVIPVVQAGITKKLTLNDLKAYAVQEIGDTYVRFLWYQEISSGTSGTITPPAGGSIVLDQWAAGVDAVTSTIGGTGQRPSFESVKDASGNIITATLDGSGNWTVSGTPSAYPIAICYVYDVKLSQADRAKSLAQLETDQGLKTTDSPKFVTVKLNNLTDGYIPKHTSDAVGLADSTVSVDTNGQVSFGTSGLRELKMDIDSCAVGLAGGSGWQYGGSFFLFGEDRTSNAGKITLRYGGSTAASLGSTGGAFEIFKRDGDITDDVVISTNMNRNVGIGVAAFGTGAVGVLGIKAGTAPSTSPADMAQLWVEDVGGAGQAELRVRDELGNVTTLSPHHVSMFVPGEDVALPWTHYHENALLGIREEVDMGGLVKAVEELTGKQFSYVQNIPKVVLGDYLANREADIRKKLAEELSYEEEIPEELATEIREVQVTTKEFKEYSQTYTFENGEKIVQSVPVYGVAKIPQKVLKTNVRLCEKTGKFFAKYQPTQATLDAEFAAKPINNLPKWIADRIN